MKSANKEPVEITREELVKYLNEDLSRNIKPSSPTWFTARC